MSYTAGVVEDHSGKMVETEGCLQVGTRFHVVLVTAVRLVQLGQHSLVRALYKQFNSVSLFTEAAVVRSLCTYFGELGFFVDERHDVHLFDGDQVERVLIVDKLNVLPTDVLLVVLLLLQFENVPHEKLLQVLVGIVDAELLETEVDNRRLEINSKIRRTERSRTC